MNRRAKGNLGERAVRAALTAQGFIVRDGSGSESGCDLYVLRQDLYLDHEAEVKARTDQTVGSLRGKEKRSLARRAAQARELGIRYYLYFVRLHGDAKLPELAEFYTVGGLEPSARRKGSALALNKQGYLHIADAKGRALYGRVGAPTHPPSAEE